eukprot:snap_masked-scaffold_14-processed-gene-3.29-mRNA-1 protein AED:1.00 eAED:1.00 QI:0/-1/0/0/-1/1/1/0/265
MVKKKKVKKEEKKKEENYAKLISRLENDLKLKIEEEIELKTKLSEMQDEKDKSARDCEEIMYVYHKKLEEKGSLMKKMEEEHENFVSTLSGRLEERSKLLDTVMKDFNEYKENTESELSAAKEKLSSFQQFSSDRDSLEMKIKNLKETLVEKEFAHENHVRELERKHLRQEEKMRQELNENLEKKKKQLEQATKDNLQSVVLNIMEENKHLKAELRFQSQEINSLLKVQLELQKELKKVKNEKKMLLFDLKSLIEFKSLQKKGEH